MLIVLIKGSLCDCVSVLGTFGGIYHRHMHRLLEVCIGVPSIILGPFCVIFTNTRATADVEEFQWVVVATVCL